LLVLVRECVVVNSIFQQVDRAVSGIAKIAQREQELCVVICG
jgi:hypothetical protein